MVATGRIAAATQSFVFSAVVLMLTAPSRPILYLLFTNKVAQFFMKLFRTSDISVVTYCREMFQFDLPSAILKKRAEKFDSVSFN